MTNKQPPFDLDFQQQASELVRLINGYQFEEANLTLCLVKDVLGADSIEYKRFRYAMRLAGYRVGGRPARRWRAYNYLR
jgi:hypothetical protein